MLILALETTADVCSVAVCDDQGVVVERAFCHRMHLSERLMGDVDGVLADAGTALAAVDALAVGIGPGSFTGVRIGVTTVKAWADVLAKPVCGVSALDALAEEYAAVPQVVVPVIRSRPDSVYACLYRGSAAGMASIGEPAAFTPTALAEALRAGAGPAGCLLVGPGLARMRLALEQALKAAGVDASFGRAEGPRASLVAAIAQRRLASGPGDDPLALVPLYIAPPPIDPRVEERMRARKRGGGP